MPKVSIIVPIYNTEKYLKKCIQSLINQTEKDIEIILINDGSTDNSEKIIKQFNDNRIRYIKKENSGIGKTRNLGIKEAIGEYIMFIDSDDYIDKKCIKKMYSKAINDNCDLVISNYYEDRDGIIRKIEYESFKDTSLKDNPAILNKINLGPCNKLYLKKLLNGINFEEKLKYEDAPFVIKTLKNANRIGKINEALSYYVIHQNSQTTTINNKIYDILEISKIIISILNDNIYIKDLTNIIVMILTDYTIQVRSLKTHKERNHFIDEAFNILNSLNKKWHKCEYFKKLPIHKRIIKSNKYLTKLYCTIYQLLK